MAKFYLGDSVYVDIERGMIRLTTWNGYPTDPSNTIYLDLEVYDALQHYVEHAMAVRPRDVTPGCDCDQPGNADAAFHASDCNWRKAQS